MVLGGYLLLAPNLQLVPEIGLYNSKRIVQVGLLCIVGLTSLLSAGVRRRWFRMWDTLPRAAQAGLLAVLGLGVVSSLAAPQPVYAGLEGGHVVLLALAAGLVASVVQQQPQRGGRVIVGLAVVSVLLYAVQFAVGFGLSLADPAVAHWPESFTGFANIRHFNQFQTWTLPLLIVPLLGLPKKRRLLRWSLLGLASLWWALVFASNVRGTVLAMAVAAAVVYVVFRRQSHEWLRMQAVALAGGGVLYVLLFYVALGMEPLLVDRLSDASQYAGRLAYWEAAAAMIQQHPILGAGPMHFAWPGNYFGAGAHPHNALVQWAAEWGLFSVLIVIGLAVWGFGAWARQSRHVLSRRTTALRVALTATLVAAAAHAMVSGIIVTPVSQMWGVVIIGGAWGCYAARPSSRWGQRSRRSRSTWTQTALCGLIAGSMLLVTWTSVQDLRTMNERRTVFLESVDRNLLSPRYWQQGFIGVRDWSTVNSQLSVESRVTDDPGQMTDDH